MSFNYDTNMLEIKNLTFDQVEIGTNEFMLIMEDSYYNIKKE